MPLEGARALLDARSWVAEELLLAASVLLLSASMVRAHGGEDHGEKAAKSTAPAAGGAVFVAKESQFLLGIRTTVASVREVQERMRVPGVVTVPPERNAAIFAPGVLSRVRDLSFLTYRMNPTQDLVRAE